MEMIIITNNILYLHFIFRTMKIQQNKKEIIITVPNNNHLDLNKLQELIDYLFAASTLSQAKGTQEQAIQTVREIDSNWWKKHKKEFLK